MDIRVKIVAAVAGAAALMGAVGVDIAQAGTYPKNGTHHVGGEGSTVTPSAVPTSLATASFTPKMDSVPQFCDIPWVTGACG